MKNSLVKEMRSITQGLWKEKRVMKPAFRAVAVVPGHAGKACAGKAGGKVGSGEESAEGECQTQHLATHSILM